MNLGTIWVAVRGDVKGVEKDLDGVKKKAVTDMGHIEKQTHSSLTKMSGYWKYLYAAAATGVLGMIGKSFIDAAKTSENYRIRLETLLGSTKEGNALFQDMAKFASGVAYQYEEIMAAATNLSGVMKGGRKEIAQYMPIITDLAAATGMGINEVTGQVIRMYSAGAASADMFRERGVLSMMGFQAGVKYSAEETRKILLDSWAKTDSKFRGTAEKLAHTWDGLMSMIKDKWFQVRNIIMDAGVYDALKDALSFINTKFGEWIEKNEELIKQKVPEYVDKIRTSIDRLVGTVERFQKLTSPFLDFWRKLKELTGKDTRFQIEELNKAIAELGLEGAKMGEPIIMPVPKGRHEPLAFKIEPPEIAPVPVLPKPPSDDEAWWKKYYEDSKESLKEWEKETESFAAAEEAIWEQRTKLYLENAEKQKKAQNELIDLEYDWEIAGEESLKKAAENYSKFTRERGEGAREVYKDLRGYEGKYYQESKKLIDQQAQRYKELGIDEVAIAKWRGEKEKEVWQSMKLESGSTFDGIKVGFQRMMDAEESWAQHSYNLWNQLGSRWQTTVNQMVDAFIQGEDYKQSYAQITGNMLVGMAGDVAKEMYKAAIGKVVGLIGVHLGLGSAIVSAEGAKKGGTAGALTEIAWYLGAGVAAMLAGKTLANQFAAEGGWIATHPYGGAIQEGSGAKDDVFLGYTPGTRHWGMGGEYVINKYSTSKHKPLLDLINNDRGMATGGYLDRKYQEGDMVDWKPAADMLAIGGGSAAAHGFVKYGGVWGAIAELIMYFATAVPQMFAGKMLSTKFGSNVFEKGGLIDRGHGWGDFFTKPLDPFIDLVKKVPVVGPIIGDDIDAILSYFDKRIGILTDPEAFWESIQGLIRAPLEGIAKDLVTPGKYYTEPLTDLILFFKSLYKEFKPEKDLIKELVSFDNGGKIPKTGIFYGHEGERVLNKEETKQYESRPPVQMNVTINPNIMTTDNAADWLKGLQYKLRNDRIGEQTSTINLTTAGIKL